VVADLRARSTIWLTYAGAPSGKVEYRPDTVAALTNAEIKPRNRQAWISKTIRPLIENLG
jgi:hypothetical protein